MKKILIIDNSIVIINVLKDLFSKKNDFKVYIAKTFKEAKELIEENNFFASISNLVLKDALNGELLQLLKSNNIPTVVLSSKIDKEIIEKVREAQVVDYITKDSMYELESAYRLIKLLSFVQHIEILVVDDSNVIVNKLKNTLEMLLFTVHTAKNGKEALEILDKNKNISMVITDHYMNEMDGLELIKQVRKIKEFSIIPMLIMTTKNDDELKIKFFKSGATDFLVKPILEEELKAKIINIFHDFRMKSEIGKFNDIIDKNVITSSTDENGIIKNVSEAFCEISGYSKEELIGQNHRMVKHPDMPDSLYEELWQTITSGKTWKGEVKNLRKDGDYYWVKVVIEPNFDRKNNIIGFTSVRQDITNRKKIYELSIRDSLTNLFNRRYFTDISQKALEHSVRNNEVFAFLLLDIDNFKKYNDNYGHQEGDEVLIKVANCLKESFKRSDDSVFRLGGEEFGVLINSKSAEDIEKLCEMARKNIEDLAIEHQYNESFGVVTASFGLTIIKNNKSLSLNTIYKLADDNLYKAKKEGRNRLSKKYL